MRRPVLETKEDGPSSRWKDRLFVMMKGNVLSVNVYGVIFVFCSCIRFLHDYGLGDE